MNARTRTLLSIWQLLALLALLILTGCDKEDPVKGKAVFKHDFHFELAEGDEEEEERFNTCSNCHNTAEAGANVQPPHDACIECHDIEMDEPGEDCLQCHEGIEEDELPEDGTLAAELFKKWMKDAMAHRDGTQQPVWDHSRVEGKVECQTCHGDVKKDNPLKASEFHRRNGVPEDCDSCHGENFRDKAPRDHAPAQSWLRSHGMASQAGQQPDCRVCHSAASFCTDCHETERPRDHNAIFRDRAHGFAAISNRERCDTCHRQDACDSCHQEVTPRSHTSYFKRQGHCQSCHIGNNPEGTSCQMCHTLDLTNQHLYGKPLDGRTLHVLPQNHGSDLRNDCQMCHDFSMPKGWRP
jgi:hypothetical protein